MSLLMEALKKAEQAKQGQPGEAAPELELRLEPIASPPAEEPPPAATTTGKALPELPQQLEALDQEFIAHHAQQAAAAAERAKPAPPAAERPKPASRPAAKPAPAADGERDAAQNLFAAKKPAGGRKGFAIAMGAFSLVAVAAIGGYFWWQLQPKSGLGPAAGQVARVTPPPAAPAAAPPPTAQAPAAPAALPAAPVSGKPADEDEEDAKPAAVPPAPTPARAAAAPAPESPIRVTSDKSKPRLNPALAQGFEALAAGRLDEARAEYGKVLKTEPKNPDALHGMAAVSLRENDPGQAQEYYARALETDPKDALAQAGLIGLNGQGDPLAAESRLKSMIAAQPDFPALHFALGNVLARQGRWSEAQQSYFKAYAAEPEHPDYAFNLAVSLDHLRQARLAAQYYGQALAAAANRPAGFDKAKAEARLRELQP